MKKRCLIFLTTLMAFNMTLQGTDTDNAGDKQKCSCREKIKFGALEVSESIPSLSYKGGLVVAEPEVYCVYFNDHAITDAALNVTANDVPNGTFNPDGTENLTRNYIRNSPADLPQFFRDLLGNSVITPATATQKAKRQPQSSWMKSYVQYNTPAQTINPGKAIYLGQYNLKISKNTKNKKHPKSFTGDEISTLVGMAIGAKIVPVNGMNTGGLPSPKLDSHGHPKTIYVVIMPSDFTVVSSLGPTCGSGGVCGYHDAHVTPSGTTYMLTVIGNCWNNFQKAGDPNKIGFKSCGDGVNSFNDLCVTISHELSETISNLVAGASNQAWTFGTDGSAKENADLCQNRFDADGNPIVGEFTGFSGKTYTVADVRSTAPGSGCISPGARALTSPAHFTVSSPQAHESNMRSEN